MESEEASRLKSRMMKEESNTLILFSKQQLKSYQNYLMPLCHVSRASLASLASNDDQTRTE
jgi:hypothetical protein